MQNSGRTKFKRTSIDRLMNTLVLWVCRRQIPGSPGSDPVGALMSCPVLSPDLRVPGVHGGDPGHRKRHLGA